MSTSGSPKRCATPSPQQEGTAFVNGDGTNKPKGFLAYTKVAERLLGWGNIGYIRPGVAGAFASTNPGDKLIDLVYALKAGYRANGTWVMNRKTQAAIRKMKDGDGNYLWQPAAKAGDAVAADGLSRSRSPRTCPTIAADSTSIAFGDFRRGYLIVDRVGVRVLRDPYQRQALRAVLHDQARRRRRAGLRRHQADEVRRVDTGE